MKCKKTSKVNAILAKSDVITTEKNATTWQRLHKVHKKDSLTAKNNAIT